MKIAFVEIAVLDTRNETMNLTTFNFNQVNVRVVNDSEGNPWFVAADVCSVLGHTNPSKAVSDHVHDDDKSNRSLGLSGKAPLVVNESGLYALIFGSRLEEAKAFKKWVTSEVLPSIRKTGTYSVNTTPARIPLDEIARSLEVANNMLNVCPSGKLKSLRTLYENYGVNANILPDYTIDASTVTAGSSEPTLPITAILERTGSKLTPVSANKKLNEVGLLKRQSRKSSNGELKYYWSVTDNGLKYGKNLTSDKNQKETQPHWYVSTMYELVDLIK